MDVEERFPDRCSDRLSDYPGLRDLFMRCVDCGADFVWSQGEQVYYSTNGLRPPKRCPGCRRIKRNSYRSSSKTLNHA